MPIAQMNWGRMRYSLTHANMQEFLKSLDSVYSLAEKHPGFIWRISDEAAASQLQDLGFDEKISATVSVWKSVDELHDYTFASAHGEYFDRRAEWFEKIEGPQLVIWNVDGHSRPGFRVAFERLEHLKANGPTDYAYGWKE